MSEACVHEPTEEEELRKNMIPKFGFKNNSGQKVELFLVNDIDSPDLNNSKDLFFESEE